MVTLGLFYSAKFLPVSEIISGVPWCHILPGAGDFFGAGGSVGTMGLLHGAMDLFSAIFFPVLEIISVPDMFSVSAMRSFHGAGDFSQNHILTHCPGADSQCWSFFLVP